jgi:hypothetical protein
MVPQNSKYLIRSGLVSFPRATPKVSAHDETLSSEVMLSMMSDPPRMEEVISYLDAFVRRLHQRFLELQRASKEAVYEAYRAAAENALLPFDARWKGRLMYPVRHGEGSIFLSIASYRDHRLENTLKEAFGKAADPTKVFAGVVMQNCFEKCKTGVHRVSPLGVKVRPSPEACPPPSWFAWPTWPSTRSCSGARLEPLRRAVPDPGGVSS